MDCEGDEQLLNVFADESAAQTYRNMVAAESPNRDGDVYVHTVPVRAVSPGRVTEHHFAWSKFSFEHGLVNWSGELSPDSLSLTRLSYDGDEAPVAALTACTVTVDDRGIILVRGTDEAQVRAAGYAAVTQALSDAGFDPANPPQRKSRSSRPL